MSQNDLRTRLLAAFASESREHLGRMRTLAVELESTDFRDRPRLDEIFRRAHSLKGAARAVGLPGVQAVAHALEDLFDRIRSDAGAVPHRSNDIARAIDALEDLSRPQAVADMGMVDGVVALLRNGRDGLAAAQAPPPPQLPPPRATAAAATPAMPQPLPSPPRDAPALVAAVAQREAGQASLPPGVAAAEGRQGLQAAAAGEVAPNVEGLQQWLRIDARSIDGIAALADEMIAELSRTTDLEHELRAMLASAHQVDQRSDELRRTARSDGAAGQARSQALLMGAIDQLLIQQRELAQRIRSYKRRHTEHSRAVSVQTTSLRSALRQIRLVPADSVFQDFAPMVRDIARQLGKQVRVECVGLHQPADRVALQELKDPVMHLLRNAIDHGVEPPGVRTAAGKSEEASIRLEVQIHGSSLRVLIQDDGPGIDAGAILAKARTLGLIDAQGGGDPFDLIFAPGFSTSSQVTAISGRGMGLAEVRATVQRLNGTVAIATEHGRGTRFTIEVPIGLTARQVLVVEVGGHQVAVPLHLINRIIRVRVEDCQNLQGAIYFDLQGRPLELQPLASLLGLADQGLPPEGGTVLVLLIGGAGKQRALRVDRIGDSIDAVMKAMPLESGQGDCFMGGVMLTDGQVALVVQPRVLLSGRALESVAGLPRSLPAGAGAEKLPILVVDDSFTTRTLEKGILETAGFEVAVAADGVEALVQIRLRRFALVVSDVEMPNMDGIELTEALTREFPQLPVILVTSLSAGHHRERAARAGAKAFMVKSSFDQTDLLSTIRTLL